jgi:two-component system, OmpR family, sensor kinase
MRTLLRAGVERASGRAGPAGVTYRVDVPDGGVVASVDPDRMSQALDNLVDNALRFAPTGTEIVLSARADGTDLIVEVTDDGSGFAAEFLPHAFERFRRPDASRSRGDGGAGLGLAIVRAIALAHGGTAVADNRPDGGARVRLVLPGAVSSRVPSEPVAGGPGEEE